MPALAPSAHLRRGFALPVLMAVMALLAIVAAAMTQSSRSSISQVRAAGDMQNLYVQAQLIRTKILKCSFDYPGGNNGGSWRLALPAASTATAVSALTCPGAPAGLQALWNGSDAVWLPNVPAGFGAWVYTNDATSARISITADDELGLPTLDAVRARFSAGEAALDNSSRRLTLTLQT